MATFNALCDQRRKPLDQFHWGLSHLVNGSPKVIPAPVSEVEGISEDGNGAIWIARAHIANFTGPICKGSGDNEQCYGKSDGIQALSAGPPRFRHARATMDWGHWQPD